MMRTLIVIATALPGFWLTLMVFAWIISGDIHLPALKLNRDQKPLLFWMMIVLPGCVSMLVLGIALAIHMGFLY